MKLRYIEIAPEIISELPDWSEADIERESELTLKDLGISREPHESYLHAWVRAMLNENSSEDNADNRKRLIEAIQQDPDVARFVWVLGGRERKLFGLNDSPAIAQHRAERDATQALVAALATAADYSHRGGQMQSQPTYVRFGMSNILWALLPVVVIGTVWLTTRDWMNRIVLSIFLGGWLVASFGPGARTEAWSRRLVLSFLGGVFAFWLSALLGMMVGAWFITQNWLFRILLWLFFGGLLAGTLEKAREGLSLKKR